MVALKFVMQPALPELERKFICKVKVQTLECKWEDAIFLGWIGISPGRLRQHLDHKIYFKSLGREVFRWLTKTFLDHLYLGKLCRYRPAVNRLGDFGLELGTSCTGAITDSIPIWIESNLLQILKSFLLSSRNTRTRALIGWRLPSYRENLHIQQTVLSFFITYVLYVDIATIPIAGSPLTLNPRSIAKKFF